MCLELSDGGQGWERAAAPASKHLIFILPPFFCKTITKTERTFGGENTKSFRLARLAEAEARGYMVSATDDTLQLHTLLLGRGKPI